MPWAAKKRSEQPFSDPFSLKKDKLPRLSHLRIPSLTLKKHWEFILEVEKQWKLFNTEKSWSPVGLEDAK
ncbi:BDH_1b_G0025660.mRNA.1.CDS.1 [Saccharomyces cerevisiae]|nr:BDH_1b_G0025660.mRNA.1.CDS.1 [Saccharomyces cerevisiae]CAI7088078.1 BDH_1b_G0025660.mRNA.1.CDS.1 [Saccharomyces cerevisiae]